MNMYGKCFNEPSADLDDTLVPWQYIFTYDKSPLKLLHVTQTYNFHVIEVVDLIYYRQFYSVKLLNIYFLSHKEPSYIWLWEICTATISVRAVTGNFLTSYSTGLQDGKLREWKYWPTNTNTYVCGNGNCGIWWNKMQEIFNIWNNTMINKIMTLQSSMYRQFWKTMAMFMSIKTGHKRTWGKTVPRFASFHLKLSWKSKETERFFIAFTKPVKIVQIIKNTRNEQNFV